MTEYDYEDDDMPGWAKVISGVLVVCSIVFFELVATYWIAVNQGGGWAFIWFLVGGPTAVSLTGVVVSAVLAALTAVTRR